MEVIIIVNMSADWHNYHCSLFSLSSILYFFILLLLTLFWKPTACHCLNPIEFLVMFEFRSVCIVFIITAIPIGRDCAISCIILFISVIIYVHYLICRPLVLQWTVLPVFTSCLFDRMLNFVAVSDDLNLLSWLMNCFVACDLCDSIPSFAQCVLSLVALFSRNISSCFLPCWVDLCIIYITLASSASTLLFGCCVLSSRRYLSSCDCLEDKEEDCQNCCVMHPVP